MILRLLLCLTFLLNFSFSHKSVSNFFKKNVCKTPKDYDTIDKNENCWYNENIDFTPVSIFFYVINRKSIERHVQSVCLYYSFYIQKSYIACVMLWHFCISQ